MPVPVDIRVAGIADPVSIQVSLIVGDGRAVVGGVGGYPSPSVSGGSGVKVPPGGVALPKSLAPQQATVPLVLTAHFVSITNPRGSPG